MMHAYGTMPWWMIISMVAFWALAVTVIVSVIVQATRSSRPRRETPLEIAQRRFATGEINRAEFEEARQALSRPPTSVGKAGLP